MNILSDYVSAFKPDYGGIVKMPFYLQNKVGRRGGFGQRREEYAKAL